MAIISKFTKLKTKKKKSLTVYNEFIQRSKNQRYKMVRIKGSKKREYTLKHYLTTVSLLIIKIRGFLFVHQKN